MKFKVEVNVSKEFKKTTICINVPEKTKEIEILEKKITSIVNEKNQLIGTKDYDFYIIDITDIIMIYSEDKYNYCKTAKGTFKLKEKLYYLEEILPANQFIRISNSTIINIKHVKCFNTGLIGKIIVYFNNGDTANVSKSRTKNIMNFLKERRNYND